jgi:predicted Zn-dependent peptidase
MDPSRRAVLKSVLAGGAVAGGIGILPLRAQGGTTHLEASSSRLDNGLRLHLVANQSRYVCAVLILRSIEIRASDGLAHLVEHTSFVGAAGEFTASELRGMRADCFQDSNATTRPGTIQWVATFLPRYLEQAIGVLAVTSLDQKFDVATVASEARVVLQELYLDRYHRRAGRRRMIANALFGPRHPYGTDTLKSEIAKAKTPPEKLAAELREYAKTIRLPANMDLVLVGGFDPTEARAIVAKHFGRFPLAQGSMLALPQAPVTRAYRTITARSHELRRPLSELSIAWNTGVHIQHPDVKAVLGLRDYLNDMLLRELRERHGDAYTPEALYEPDACSGVFEINIPSTAAPARIERKVFAGIAGLQGDIDIRELTRCRDRAELRRRKNAESTEALAERLGDKLIEGGSVYDLDLETLTCDSIRAAARKYLPSYRSAYIRLALLGR